MHDNDLGLVEDVKKGDYRSFDLLCRRYAQRIYSLLFRMVKNSHDAEDLSQEVFLQAFKSINKFRGDCSFYTWIYRIAVNKALNKMRIKKPAFDSIDDPVTVGDGEMQREIPDLEMSPEKTMADRELRKILENAIQKLPDLNRTIFVLREIEDIPYEEISSMLGCSQESIRTRLHRTKKELKRLIEPYLLRGNGFSQA